MAGAKLTKTVTLDSAGRLKLSTVPLTSLLSRALRYSDVRFVWRVVSVQAEHNNSLLKYECGTILAIVISPVSLPSA